MMFNPILSVQARRMFLLLTLLGAFALRLYRLGTSSLWYDETVSLFLARQDLVSLTRHTAGDIHPPLYYYLLHFWGPFAGWSEFSAAFVSLFFGVLLIALVYRVGREWFNANAALIAASLVAISPYNLWYSQEVRMYTLGATLGLASVYFFVRMLESFRFPVPGSKLFVSHDFLAYVILSALGLYTLYYFAFLLVFENLIAVILILQPLRFAMHSGLGKPPATIFEVGWLASQLSIFFFYLPWLPIAFRQATDPPVPPWRSFTPLPNVLLESFSALALGQSLDPILTWPILIIIAAVLIFALAADGRNRSKDESRMTKSHLKNNSSGSNAAEMRHVGAPPAIFETSPSLFLFGYTWVPLLAIYAFSLWKPLYHVRYVFIYSPGFYLLWAVGLERMLKLKVDFRKYAAAIASGTLLLIAAVAYSDYNFWFNPRYAHDDLRGAVQRIAELWRPGDAIVINAGYTYTALVYYYDQPIAWRGRLINYPPRAISLGSVQRLVDLRLASIVLQTGSLGGSVSLGWGSPESDFYATTADETHAALDRVFALHPRVWMLRLYDTVVDPDGVIRDYIAQHGRLIDDQVFTGESNARVQSYLTSRAPLTTLPDGATPREVVLGNRIALLGLAPAEITVRAGNAIDATLYWRAKQPTNVDEHVFIGLFSENGKLVASSDETPLGNALGTSRWLPEEIMREPLRLVVPADVQPGKYFMRIVMYDPFTKEPLTGGDNEWVVEKSQIKITEVRVE